MKSSLAKSIAFSALSVFFASAAFAAPETYVLDPNHTNIVWFANHFGFSNPSGKFANVQGTLVMDEANPGDSKLNVTVSPATVITGVPKLDEHLKSEAFFDVAKFPTATFTSTKVDVIDAHTAKVTGNLTLHGITKPLTLDVTLNKIGEHPMTKKKTAGFSATAILKRSDFGVNYGIPNVSDDVKLSIESEASVQ